MSELTFKRKFRWTIEGTLPGGELKPVFVKVMKRPTLQVDETNFLDPKSFIPGKGKWDVINITTWDVNEEFKKVIISSVFEDPTKTPLLSTFKIVLYDGCGFGLEEWELEQAYIRKLSYLPIEDDIENIEIEISYEQAKYKSFYSKFPDQTPTPTPTLPMGMRPMGSMGMGFIGHKTKCPKCEHEFDASRPDIIY